MLRIIANSYQTSIKALWSNKLRSALTMAGIIIGVGAVVVIVAVGAGAQSLIVAQVKSLGSNLVGVLPGKADDDGPPASVMGIVITTLTLDDAYALLDKKRVPHLTDMVAYSKGFGSVVWGSESYDTNWSGCTTGHLTVEGGAVEQGRFFTSDEERGLARVVVLGSTVAGELFGNSDPIGARVKIKKQSFEVIGVMKERGQVALQDYDDQVFVPIVAMQKLILGVDHVGLIRGEVDFEENIDVTITDMESVLRDRHDIDDQSGQSDDFTIRSAADALEMITTITNALRYFLAAMAAISLLVGGIGIMNIMLISVTERTREIGLRMAVGAKRGDILWQFLFESLSVTLLGGAIGVAGGILIALLVALVAQGLGYDWSFVVTPSSVILALGVSGLVGIVFGIYPARRASRLEPVEALRYE